MSTTYLVIKIHSALFANVMKIRKDNLNSSFEDFNGNMPVVYILAYVVYRLLIKTFINA